MADKRKVHRGAVPKGLFWGFFLAEIPDFICLCAATKFSFSRENGACDFFSMIQSVIFSHRFSLWEEGW